MTISVSRSTADGTSTVRCTTEPRSETGVRSVIDRSEGRDVRDLGPPLVDIDSMIPARGPFARNPRRSQPAIAQQGQNGRKREPPNDRRVERDRRRQPDPQLLELEQREGRE